MIHYLYLDYGRLTKYRRELKYSLISLRSDLDRRADAKIAVYTDDPASYARWPVEVVDIGARLSAWSAEGLYFHRVKPAVILEALGRFATPVCFVDCDSIVKSGFHAELTTKTAAQTAGGAAKAAMNQFERINPYPPLKGFRTQLPHLGSYRYDVGQSWMYNSGLVALGPEHGGVMEDTLCFIDALIGRAKKFPAIEQFALSEVLRLNEIPIVEVKDSFLHYWQGRRRIYMANHIQKNLAADWNDLTAPKQWATMNYWAVRAYNYYYGITHFFAGGK